MPRWAKLFKTSAKDEEAIAKGLEVGFNTEKEFKTASFNMSKIMSKMKSYIGYKPDLPISDFKNTLSNASTSLVPVDSLFEYIGENAIKSASGLVVVNKLPINKVFHQIQSGDLLGTLKSVGHDIPVSNLDQKAFKTVLGETPEVNLKNMTDNYRNIKTKHPSLDGPLETLPKSSISKFEAMEKSLIAAKNGAILTLTIGAAVVGVGVIKKLMRQRTGCFFISSVGGKKSSCKIRVLSCASPDENGATPCDNLGNVMKYQNPSIILISVLNSSDTSATKIAFSEALNFTSVEEMCRTENIKELMNSRFDDILLSETSGLVIMAFF